jgi:GNAT superfamily N-acetyltransferase
MLAVDPLAGAGDADRRAHLTRAAVEDICFVVVDDLAARGFVVIRPRHFYDRDFIDVLMVAADHRRQGLGRALMRTAVAAATSAAVFTSTNESNAAMRALLESEGWSLSGKLDGLDDGDPELVYYLRR